MVRRIGGVSEALISLLRHRLETEKARVSGNAKGMGRLRRFQSGRQRTARVPGLGVGA
jgi:hypothetical protein